MPLHRFEIEGLRARVTHEKCILTYQFRNTVSEAADDLFLKISHLSLHGMVHDFLGISGNFPSSICGLVQSGSQSFNYRLSPLKPGCSDASLPPHVQGAEGSAIGRMARSMVDEMANITIMTYMMSIPHAMKDEK